jgi:chromosome partitioning protein
VVIDCGAKDSEALRMALVLADTVLVPVQPRGLDIWALGQIDAAAAVSDFPALTLRDAPIRRRKAFAAAAVRGLLVEELPPPIDSKAIHELSALASIVFNGEVDGELP